MTEEERRLSLFLLGIFLDSPSHALGYIPFFAQLADLNGSRRRRRRRRIDHAACSLSPRLAGKALFLVTFARRRLFSIYPRVGVTC